MNTKTNKYSFDDIVVFARTGLNPRDNFKLGLGNNNYITIKNIQNNTLIIDKNTDLIDDDALKLIHKRSQIKKGDILFASIGRMGDMYIIPEEPTGWDINESVFAFTLNTNIITQKYFYYIFKNQATIDYLQKNSSGSTFKSIKMNQLKKMHFQLPTIEEQKQISNILDKVTKIIVENKKLLEKYDVLIKSRFIEMFGDIQTYKKEAFKDCSLFIDYRGHTPEVTETGEIRMINAKSVGKGFFKYINEYITKEIYDVWMHRGFPKANDVLFVTEGHTFGNTCQVPSDFKIFALGQRVITIRGNEGKLNNFYLNSYMQTDDFNQDINKYKTGGTAQGIRSKDLIKVEIPIPPYEKQLQFATFVQQIDKSKFEYDSEEVAA